MDMLFNPSVTETFGNVTLEAMASGLPVVADRRQPIEIMRQVQITAGALIVLGVLLSLWVAPQFIALSGFVGAGLMFAGISGWCGMAKLLGLMPWNRRPLQQAAP